MWRPAELGPLIAQRHLTFRPHRGRPRKVTVKLGLPVRSPNPEQGDPWWCPYEIIGLGERKVLAAAGEDSVQALVLVMRDLEETLLSRAKRASGEIDWLGETERPVFAHTFFTEAYEAAIANLVEGLKLARELVENPGGSLRFAKQTERLRQIDRKSGLLSIRDRAPDTRE